MEAKDIHVGDKVRVYNINGKRLGQPDGGWEGEVVKVSRALVTVRTERGEAEVFRLDTQHWNDRNFGFHGWFRTTGQAALDDRERIAIDVLHEHKVKLVLGHSLTLEQIEALAEVFAD